MHFSFVTGDYQAFMIGGWLHSDYQQPPAKTHKPSVFNNSCQPVSRPVLQGPKEKNLVFWETTIKKKYYAS